MSVEPLDELPHGGWRHFLRALLPPREPVNEVYGTLTAAALLAVESDRRETLWEAGLSVSVAIVALWLAHGYARGVGHRFGEGDDSPWTLFARGLWTEVGILRGLLVPVLVLVLCGMAGAPDSLAVNLALTASIVVLVSIELLSGLQARRRPRDVVFEVVVSVSLGLGVVILKALLH
jgi:hypothetical protein